jgi:hypothetical protein
MNWVNFSGGDDEFNTAKQAAINAKARYFMLYLQTQGSLPSVYRAFLARKIGEDPAALLSSALGLDLATVETRFKAWFEKTNP